MTVELNMVGVKCNLACKYCYENPMRDAGNHAPKRYSLPKMLAGLSKFNQEFSVFGGEPLLANIKDLEFVWEFGLTKNGKNGIQTNGVLITDAHIELFKKYRVHVGISFDGPGELNDARISSNTSRDTEKTNANIFRLIKEHGRDNVSLIITLSSTNARGYRLELLKNWIRELDEAGMQNARIHMLELNKCDDLRLTVDETLYALEQLDKLEKELKSLKFDLFNEMRKTLSGDYNVSCIWTGCDPLTTPAVQAIDADGSLVNCGRTNKDGVNWLKSKTWDNLRSRVLWSTPFEYGGCKGCKFFLACRGECPGTGINGDWRNRTEHCEVLYKLFEKFEKEVVPVLADEESVSKVLQNNNSNHADSHSNYGHTNSYAVAEVRSGKSGNARRLL